MWESTGTQTAMPCGTGEEKEEEKEEEEEQEEEEKGREEEEAGPSPSLTDQFQVRQARGRLSQRLRQIRSMMQDSPCHSALQGNPKDPPPAVL